MVVVISVIIFLHQTAFGRRHFQMDFFVAGEYLTFVYWGILHVFCRLLFLFAALATIPKITLDLYFCKVFTNQEYS